MLQERITIIGTGFKILKDMGNPNKEAYYTSFTLRDLYMRVGGEKWESFRRICFLYK